ncbi:hypothetical protein AB1Y20_022840 [Prymnesium parvum]|uniref:F-box domain-containing protein n=1 Tax=Prymnesium parvum TaxID=97485 RepID=A0AB34JDZ8_PRYPA
MPTGLPKREDSPRQHVCLTRLTRRMSEARPPLPPRDRLPAADEASGSASSTRWLGDLPDDLVHHILLQLSDSRALSAASRVNRSWHLHALLRAEALARACCTLPRSTPRATRPSWIRSLRALEARQWVKASRAGGWRGEASHLLLLKHALHHPPAAWAAARPSALDVDAWLAAKVEAVGGARLREMAEQQAGEIVSNAHETVAWRTEKAGWPRELAESYTVMMQNCKEVLGFALECRLALRAAGRPDASSLLGASLGQLQDAFSFAARLQHGAAPRAYRHLHGQFGLSSNDAVWAALDKAKGSRLPTFTTNAPVEASADKRCLTPTGYATPVVNADTGVISYEGASSSAVVCFESGPASADGFHSMVLTLQDENEAQYDLPPGATVTCVRVQEPGTWEAFGGAIRPKCHCYTVRVHYVL